MKPVSSCLLPTPIKYGILFSYVATGNAYRSYLTRLPLAMCRSDLSCLIGVTYANLLFNGKQGRESGKLHFYWSRGVTVSQTVPRTVPIVHNSDPSIAISYILYVTI